MEVKRRNWTRAGDAASWGEESSNLDGEGVSGFSCGQDQIQKLFQDPGCGSPDDVFSILIGVDDFLLTASDNFPFAGTLFVE